MEWTVVTVIAALFGLFAGLWKPLSKLKEAITELREAARYLRDAFNEQKAHNEKAHDEMSAALREHDGRLGDHEQRICRLEHKY